MSDEVVKYPGAPRWVVVLMSITMLAVVFSLWNQSRISATADDDRDAGIKRNAYWVECLAQWGDASSQRDKALNIVANERDLQRGLRDEAHRALVDLYGTSPSSAENREAVRLFDEADDAVKEAEKAMDTARKDYPPPELKDYCKRLKSVKLPKANGTTAPKRSPPPQTR